MTGLDWIQNMLGNVPQPVASMVNAGMQEGRSIIFADGSRPAGIDPAQIYAWFHNGPGTAGYVAAGDNLRGLAGVFPDYASDLKAAQQALSAGWRGTAADNAVRSFDPLLQQADALTTHVQHADAAVGDQITSFTDTRNRVVSVAATPPSGPGMSQFVNPLSSNNLTADAAVAAYQLGTHDNQDAYGAYQGQTSPQSRRLPQTGATSTSLTRKPNQSGSTSSSSSRTSTDNSPQVPPSTSAQPPSPTQQSSAGSMPSSNSPATQQPPTSSLSPSTRSSSTPSSATGVPPTSTSSATTPSASDYSPPPTTTPSTANWSPAGTPGLGTHTVSGPGSAARFGSGSSGGGLGGAGGFAAGAPGVGGRPAPGPESTVERPAGAASRAGLVGRPGRAGTSGGPGMSGNGTGRREEDKEYRGLGIVKQEWETDLIGELPPTTAAVIEAIDDDE